MAQNDSHVYGNPSQFASEMKKMVNCKDMSDIKFVIGPSRKAVYAHKCILSARCDVFRAMFADLSSKHKDGEVPFVLSDMTPEIFLPMMEYIYTNAVTLTSKNAIDVLGTAIEYGLDGLKQLCIGYLMDNLCVNSACETMQAAYTYNLVDLKERTMKYIEHSTQKVFQSKGFHEMSDGALATVLHSDNLTIDEIDVLNAVKEWANVNSVVLSKSVGHVSKKVVIHVRLPLLSPEELKRVEEDNDKDKMIPVEHISFAWKCHALKQADTGHKITTRRKGTQPRESHQGLQNL